MIATSPVTPRVSVIVAAYNQDRFIGRCLRSLLYQTIPHDDYEIIVVNDGSTDRTPYALELFHDAIRTITHDKNRGLPAALNCGILAAQGEYVVRVDSDDFVNTNFINFLRFFLDTNEYADAVACDYLLLDDTENVLQRVNCMEHPIGCGVMFRKQQLLEIGLYDEAFRLHEERDLRIRFDRHYTVHRLELPLYRYRRHETNITNNVADMKNFHDQLVRKHGEQIFNEEKL